MNNPNKFLNKLFEVQVTTHVMHLQTTNYNDHKVLGEFYEAMLGFSDEFAEQYQSNMGEIITQVGSIEVREASQPISYIEDFKTILEEVHSECELITVKLVLESILTCVNKTLYLLKLE